MSEDKKRSFREKALETAESFDYKKSVKKTLGIYEDAVRKKHETKDAKKSIWTDAKRSIKTEMEIISNIVRSAGAVISDNGEEGKAGKKGGEDG